ncbi:threonine-phosphate decarboxylase CobD [Paenibacillus methanolicus]|uniref:threonine-phosphate decarboxylase n=1 Tax=Paenibacillus methanolicus TaxID=582686 RepID=A0A5S5CDT8_9BACL|nr:threonine-phosphate decarboxylase CobD [Paenibacillus methanolicus]TYP77555.1 threonine-phosphate decarboxylase [Paenibacillus methanolicus]
MLEKFGHGGDLLTAQELYGIPAERFVDFSANMNPFGPPAVVGELLRAYAEAIGRYPDPAVRGLRRKLAGYHGVSEDELLVGNGAAELIDLAVRVLKPAEVVLVQPCFAEYGDAARKNGIPIRTIRLAPDPRFMLGSEDVERTVRELREAGRTAGEAIWFLGHPNNPTGQLIEPETIRLLLEQGERVVLDEAFMDFVGGSARYSFLGEAARTEGGQLIVIRSMTKFYAIPGIRLGYMVADAATIASLREQQVPWSVNSLAQLIGEAVLDEDEYARRTLAWLREERAWLTGQLETLGLIVSEGHVNYVLFRIPPRFGLTAGELQRKLGERGVLIRDASHFEGLDETYCRVAVRFRNEHVLMLVALRAALREESDGTDNVSRDASRKGGEGR